jgi:hypothetical protein
MLGPLGADGRRQDVLRVDLLLEPGDERSCARGRVRATLGVESVGGGACPQHPLLGGKRKAVQSTNLQGSCTRTADVPAVLRSFRSASFVEGTFTGKYPDRSLYIR